MRIREIVIYKQKKETKGELEKLSLQFATMQTEIKAWLMQFVARIEAGYNRAIIFYTYSMIDLFSTSENLRNAFPHLGGISFPETANTGC